MSPGPRWISTAAETCCEGLKAFALATRPCYRRAGLYPSGWKQAQIGTFPALVKKELT